MDMILKGKVKLDGFITHRFPLDEYKKAFKLVGGKGDNKVIKAVFEIG
jgi:threonine dehydrogenase-like Zn-dependent dehydrogenase